MHLGEKDFAETCHQLFKNGSRWLDENLFDGEYYRHRIVTPEDGLVAEGLAWDMGAKDRSEPDLQLAGGCLVDQLFGQFLAHVCGLGYLASQANIRKTLKSILRYNRKSDFYGHFNHMRSYVLNDESALVMASYPRGDRPERPFPYFNEVMTGFEYVAAIGLLYENEEDAGLHCIKAIRDRYDGRTRSPFNEAECGHHYARAMASWAAILALSGFHYSAVTGTLTFRATREKSRIPFFQRRKSSICCGISWRDCGLFIVSYHSAPSSRGRVGSHYCTGGKCTVSRLRSRQKLSCSGRVLRVGTRLCANRNY
jgi:non-lysosomal glucosylceramidase